MNDIERLDTLRRDIELIQVTLDHAYDIVTNILQQQEQAKVQRRKFSKQFRVISLEDRRAMGGATR